MNKFLVNSADDDIAAFIKKYYTSVGEENK